MLSALVEPASTEGIHLSLATSDWDATQTDVTARLIDEWFMRSQQAEEFVVLVSNFSGDLKNATTFDSFSPSLEHILARLHGKRSTLLWVEPEMKSTPGFLRRLTGFFSALIKRFRVPWESKAPDLAARYQIAHPLKQHVHDSNVTILNFTRQ